MNQKRAIIDIGSNTVRLVVYNGPPRAPIVLLNEKVTPRLGKDVARDGVLSEKAMDVALAGLRRYAALLRMMDIDQVETVATAAARDARNGPDFLDRIRALGLQPRLLSGAEEARTSATGVMAAFPGAKGIAGDLGGGSLELIAIGSGECGEGITLPFGTLRLPDLRAEGAAKFAETVRAGLKRVQWSHGKGEPFFIVGGSWRALALHAMHQSGWPLDDPHDFELLAQDARRVCGQLAKGKIDGTDPRISSSRLATLPDAAALLGALVEEIEPSRIVFSSWGLREGVLYSMLDPELQALDPMLSGVTAFAEGCLVDPASAKAVTDWTTPVLGNPAAEDENRRLAATMLALATMRSEPNMRTEQAMQWALRKRWIGLDARGRAMLAMSALANSDITEVPSEFALLASEEDMRTAITWGLSVRLCRKLTGGTRAALEGTAIFREGNRLVLSLPGACSPLASNSVLKSLRTLAEWLGLEGEVETG